METFYIAGGALLLPLFVSMGAIGLVGASAAIEIGALTSETVTLRSLPAAWTSRRHKRHAVKQASANGLNRSSRWRFLTAPAIAYWSWWLALAAGGLLLTIAALPAINGLLFEHCLRLALQGLEQTHGMVVTYESAEGNWLKGRAELFGARFQRHGHTISDFNLTIDRLDVDCDARKAISGQLVFESVAASSVRGRYTKTGKRDASQPRRHYTIDRLTINDATLDFVDRSRPPLVRRLPLEVASLEVDDYRSRWPVFDVLFRSNTRGTVYGRPFEITNGAADEANESTFKVTGLPLSLLGQRISAPLGGRVDGLVDADIRTQWQPHDESTELKMHCRLLAHNLTVQMPNGLVQRAAAPAIASRTPRHLPLEFDLVMNKREFDGQTSFFDTGIVESIGREASRRRRPPPPPKPSSTINRAFRRFGAGVRSLVNPRGR